MSGDNKTIAMTGATGFVGSRTLDLAVRAGYHVRALTRRAQDDRPKVTWVRGSLDQSASLTELCTGTDAVIHIAGVVNAPTRKGFEAGNASGTLATVEAAKKAGVNRFIHVSSLAANFPELSIYGDTKAKAEKVVSASGLDWTIIRPPAVYGPGDKDMLDLFKMARFGFILLPPDADGRLSLVHADDLARALLAVVPSHEELTAQIFEVDDGVDAGWTQQGFARAIGDAMTKRIKPLAISKPIMELVARTDRLLRGDKAKLTIDRIGYFCHDDLTIDIEKRPPLSIWTPKIETCKGLKETAQWYRRNDWL